MPLKIICSWCGKYMGTKDAEGLSDEAPRISHSICTECRERVLKETEELLINNPNNRKQTIHERRL